METHHIYWNYPIAVTANSVFSKPIKHNITILTVQKGTGSQKPSLKIFPNFYRQLKFKYTILKKKRTHSSDHLGLCDRL